MKGVAVLAVDGWLKSLCEDYESAETRWWLQIFL